VCAHTHSQHAGLCNYKMHKKYWCAHTHILSMQVCVITKCIKISGARTHTFSHVCVRTHTYCAHTHIPGKYSPRTYRVSRKTFLLYIQGFEQNVLLVSNIMLKCVCELFYLYWVFFSNVCVCAPAFSPQMCGKILVCAHTHSQRAGWQRPVGCLIS